jgi:predicted dehydrogenase
MKVLIIGFGSIGKRHHQILTGLLGQENVYIVTRRETDTENRYSSLYSVNDIYDFDYFVIASRTSEHFGDLNYINSKVSGKTILVEKPLFETKRPALKINNKVFVAYNLRFHPLIIQCKEKLKNKKIISAKFYAGQYLPTWRPNTDYRTSYSAKKEEGGGILLDYSHDIDLIRYLLGEIDVSESINAKISDLEITSDDYLSMFGITKNNIHFSLSLDSISKIQKRDIQINTENETIEIDLIGNVLKIKEDNEEIVIYKLENYVRNLSFEHMHNLILKSNLEEIATFDDGIRLCEIFDEIRNNSSSKEWS